MLCTGIPACLHPSPPLSPPRRHALGAVPAPSLRHQHSHPCGCTRPRSRYQHPTAALAPERGLPRHGGWAPRQGMCRELPARGARGVRGRLGSKWQQEDPRRMPVPSCLPHGARISPPASPHVTRAHPFTPPHACPVTSHRRCTPCPADQPCVVPLPGEDALISLCTGFARRGFGNGGLQWWLL